MPFFVKVDEQLHVVGVGETLERKSAIAVEDIDVSTHTHKNGSHGHMLMIAGKVQWCPQKRGGRVGFDLLDDK